MNSRTLLFLNLLFSFIFLASSVFAGKKKVFIQQKSDLKTIQSQVQKSEKKLDSLIQQQFEIQKSISNYDQKISSDIVITRKLKKKLKELKNEINTEENNLNENSEMLDRTKRRYLGNIRQFYMSTHKSPDKYIFDQDYEMTLSRQIIYLNALFQFDSANIDIASELLSETETKLKNLSGEKFQVSKIRRKTETSISLERSKKKVQEKKISKLKREELNESDRMLMLMEAAKEMEAILLRLEREQAKKEKHKKDKGKSIFASLKGQLRAPCRGKIIIPFGEFVDKKTFLTSFNPGISIKGSPGRVVTAVAAGTVAYLGVLRGYGNFVIINHDNVYYTTYAGLDKVEVTKDQFVYTGARLGNVAENGIIKFELREGSKAVDPVKWIKIDAF